MSPAVMIFAIVVLSLTLGHLAARVVIAASETCPPNDAICEATP